MKPEPKIKSRQDKSNLINFRVPLALLSAFLFVQPTNIIAQPQQPPEKPAKGFLLTSPAFESDAAIPAKFTCSGANISPALSWTDPPAGTQSLVLIVDDPDAHSATPVVHWLIYAIPAVTRALPEAMPGKANLPNGSRQGKNTEGKTGYRGPCPDPGKVHHYFFKLYALDYTPTLKPKAKITDVEAVLTDHVLAKSELIGRFQRE